MISKIINNVISITLKSLLKIAQPSIPILFKGKDGIKDLVSYIIKSDEKKVFLITTPGMIRRKTLEPYINIFNQKNIDVTIFTDVPPNPTIDTVEKGYKKLLESGSGVVFAVGGGSVIDSAKAIAVLGSMHCGTKKIIGLFKVKSILPLYVIPTTSGSGSEVTNVAVISDPISHEKLFIFSNKIIPKAIAIDPKATLDLPLGLTAATGMDALTHAIEAYVSSIDDSVSSKYSIEAVNTIFNNLEKAYKNGSDIDARLNMADASYKAGLAFSRTGLGYVHGISHQITAYYGISHGLANAVILPYVLEYLMEKDNAKISSLAKLSLGISGENDEKISKVFIKKIRDLLKSLDIPSGFEELKENDMKNISKLARKEAIYSYPLTVIMSDEECLSMLNKLKK